MTVVAQTQPRPDVHGMVVIHRVFRRESRLLAEMIAAVPVGDRDRAAILAGHFRDYRDGLHGHHTGEDELIWPLLLARVDLEADIVLRMEAQHERLDETLQRLGPLVDAWERTAGESERDAVVAGLVDHRAVLVEHVDEEEESLLPLAEQHLTVAEWGALGEHFVEITPKPKLLLFLGMVLEEADRKEQAEILGALPRPARLIWHTLGRVLYARYVRRVRATTR